MVNTILCDRTLYFSLSLDIGMAVQQSVFYVQLFDEKGVVKMKSVSVNGYRTHSPWIIFQCIYFFNPLVSTHHCINPACSQMCTELLLAQLDTSVVLCWLVEICAKWFVHLYSDVCWKSDFQHWVWDWGLSSALLLKSGLKSQPCVLPFIHYSLHIYYLPLVKLPWTWDPSFCQLT